VKRELEMQRIQIKEQLRGLTSLTNHINQKILDTRAWALNRLEVVPEIEEFRWMVGLCKFFAIFSALYT
jgi:hypothetical protein